jgi:hypothetical protein
MNEILDFGAGQGFMAFACGQCQQMIFDDTDLHCISVYPVYNFIFEY